MNKLSHFLGIAAALSAVLGHVQPAAAEITLPGRCHQGYCYDTIYLGKTLLERGSDGVLYAVETAIQWHEGRTDVAKESYVYCSTTKPAVIFAVDSTDGPYRASLLNPGERQPIGAFMSSYPVYWATCHNLVGPRFDVSEDRAREMGYSMNLQESQIAIDDPRDFLK
jgi:hypothetical protein